MVKVKPTETKNKISVKTNSEINVYSIKDNLSEFYAKQAENWAHSGVMVNGIDYSSKYYAEQSKASAQIASDIKSETQALVDSFDNKAQIAQADLEQCRVDSANYLNDVYTNITLNFQEETNNALNELAEVLGEIDIAKTNAVDSINTTKTDIITDIEFVADGEKKEIVNLADVIKDSAEDIIGRVGISMFDTIFKDHILTYEESKGLALQGTYVYKNAVAGSRYGYPNFYNKCLEEYNEATEEMAFIQPINPSGISSTSGFSNASNAFDGDSSTYASCGTSTDYIEWDLGKTITISGFNASNQQVSSVSRACNVAIYSVDSSGNETLLANGTGAPVKGDGTSSATFTPTKVNKLRFKLIPADDGDAITTQYPSRILQINIIATNPKHRKNSNGHIFYDISLKNEIDEIFTSTGMAWYYGIDTENERIFLPRNNWFEQVTGNISEVGLGVKAGLPNIEGKMAIHAMVDTYSGAIYELTTTHKRLGGEQGYTVYDTGFNASKSNPIYGNSDTVQPNAVKKLLYICVGNTESVSSITDVVEVTTTENDTIPLLTGMYFDFTPNNISWLKGGQQANNAGIYKTCYNELVNVLNGETKYGDLKVINVADMIADVDYSEYWKVNQDDMTFTCPTRTSERILVAKKTVTQDDSTWYNLYSDGWCEQGGFTFTTTGTVAGVNLLRPYIYDGGRSYSIMAIDGGGARTPFGCEIVNGSSFTIFMAAAGNGGWWRTAGYTAIPTINEYTENVNLYFKVANAVQNLELLDAGEVLEAVNNVVPNNSSLIASYAMPSNRYIDLTLGASGTDYTAPANGYVVLRSNTTGTWSFIHLFDPTTFRGNTSLVTISNVQALLQTLPVQKGQKFRIDYDQRNFIMFRFVYAQGEV